MSDNAKLVATRLKTFGFAAIGVIVLVVALVLTPLEDDDTTVSGPDVELTAHTVANLARASAAQGICYGWHLIDRARSVSRGSNLGPDTAVDSDPIRCPKWIQVEALVWYSAPDSEASDQAFVKIIASGVPAPPASHLDRLGLTSGAFIEAPDQAICQAAMALPLLAQESADASPMPTAPPAATPTSVPAALPDVGSDFWRDRWVHVLGAALLLLVAALTIAIGWFERRAERAGIAAGRVGKTSDRVGKRVWKT